MKRALKRFGMSALIAAQLGVLAIACTNEKVIGPVMGALPANIRDFISPQKDNALTMDEDELLYVPPADVNDFLSADSANALRIGKDGLLYTKVLEGGSGGRGPEGPEGPEGPAGAEGPKGDPGTSVKIVGSVNTHEQLPSSAEPGDGYMVESTGHLWVWAGTGWTDAGELKGPAGERGPQGEQGARGPEGAEGPKGAKGDEGPAGPKGAKGDQGPEGPQGERGPEGPQGPAGPSGMPLSIKQYSTENPGTGSVTLKLPMSDADGLVMVYCNTNEHSFEHVPAPCEAIAWEGFLEVRVSNLAHDIGPVEVTLLGFYDS